MLAASCFLHSWMQVCLVGPPCPNSSGCGNRPLSTAGEARGFSPAVRMASGACASPRATVCRGGPEPEPPPQGEAAPGGKPKPRRPDLSAGREAAMGARGWNSPNLGSGGNGVRRSASFGGPSCSCAGVHGVSANREPLLRRERSFGTRMLYTVEFPHQPALYSSTTRGRYLPPPPTHTHFFLRYNWSLLNFISLSTAV